MGLSGMSSKEKTIVAVLAVVIVISLIAIGLLIARLVVGSGDSEQTTGIIPPMATSEGLAAPVATSEGPSVPGPTSEGTAPPQPSVTPVPNPTLVEAAQEPPESGDGQRAAVAREESPGPILPAILMNQSLHGGHRYQVEITTKDGSKVHIWGSWSQSAKGADGSLELPLPEFIEGATPFTIDVVPPLDNPASWSVSVSASPKNLLGQPPPLVITVWDVTGSG